MQPWATRKKLVARLKLGIWAGDGRVWETRGFADEIDDIQPGPKLLAQKGFDSGRRK